MADEKKQPIGALWEKTSQSGTVFLSGDIEIDGVKHPVVCFQNGYKKESKHPDWRIFKSEERQQGGSGERRPAPQPAREEQRHSRPHDTPVYDPPLPEDDIPF